MRRNDQSPVGSRTGADTVGVARAQLRFESSLFSFFFLRTLKRWQAPLFFCRSSAILFHPSHSHPRQFLLIAYWIIALRLEPFFGLREFRFSCWQPTCCVAEPQICIVRSPDSHPFSYNTRRRGQAWSCAEKGARKVCLCRQSFVVCRFLHVAQLACTSARCRHSQLQRNSDQRLQQRYLLSL